MAEEERTRQKKQTRKRIRNPAEWKREKRKRLRIAGKSYINSRGDMVKERKIGEDCKCRRKCYSRVPEDQRNKLFDGYYSLNSHDEQNAYLFGLIRKHDIARKRCKESDRRTCSYKYYVRIRGKEIQICRLAFANIHGISPHKIRILCQKQDQNIMFPRDGRGKHNNRPRKISEDILHRIKEHIYSIISSDRVCDFLREEKHIGPDVNITKMWKDYLEKYDPHYKEIFAGSETEELNVAKDNNVLDETNCPLITAFPESELIDDPQTQHFSSAVDLSEYPLSSVTDSLELLESSESQFNEESSGLKKTQHTPIVKHWLYSKVFHDEFKINDFVSLKKKICQLKDVIKLPSNNGGKSERKQRSPKKITREKDSCPHGSVNEPVPVLNTISPTNYSLDASSSDIQTLNGGQNTDMYILPVNLQDLSSIPQMSEISAQPQHAVQFNLHTFSAQNNVLNPIVNVPGPAQGIQCSSVVSLPGGTVGFSQNTCGYMNLNMAAFY